ncbi:jg21452 [Pararge aegeria aegeria]|uniref:Jg21452 protein n=1 Tax=Pararge aegeria aegeria TaxID=348720 RepID=A0A8S4QHD4_9NEOP|nr:jg21452 [Pararge aegeria aegeria]
MQFGTPYKGLMSSSVRPPTDMIIMMNVAVEEPPLLARVCACSGTTKPLLPEDSQPYCLQFQDLPVGTGWYNKCFTHFTTRFTSECSSHCLLLPAVVLRGDWGMNGELAATSSVLLLPPTRLPSVVIMGKPSRWVRPFRFQQ